MTLNKRERYVAIAAGAVLGLLAVDQLFLSPLLSRLSAATASVDALSREKRDADGLIQNEQRARTRWKEIAADTLKSDSSAAEGQLLNNVREWARSADLSLNSIKPERSERQQGFEKITLRAVGNGSMHQIGRFLHSVQTSNVPVRISDFQINTRKEGTDELSLQVGLSTIFQLPDEKAPATPPRKETAQ